jgi:hypothetical protein
MRLRTIVGHAATIACVVGCYDLVGLESDYRLVDAATAPGRDDGGGGRDPDAPTGGRGGAAGRSSPADAAAGAGGGDAGPDASGDAGPDAGGSAGEGGESGRGGTGGEPSEDPCDDIVCDEQRAPECPTPTTRRTFAATGTCSAGECSYEPTDDPCPSNQACDDGACSLCGTVAQCGATCIACTGNTPNCMVEGNTSRCVACLRASDCAANQICDYATGACVEGALSLLLCNGTSVLKFDITTGASQGTFATGGGLGLCYGLAQGPDGNLYVADFTSETVLEFAGSNGAFLSSITVSASPYDVAFGPNGDLFVGVSGGNVLRYNPTTGAALGTFATAPALSDHGGLLFHEDSLFISFIGTPGTLYRYNATTGALIGLVYDGFTSNGPRKPTVAPDGALFVPNWQSPNVAKFDPTTFAFAGNHISDAAGSPNSVAFGRDGHLLVLSDYLTPAGAVVRRYDVETGAFLNTLIPATGRSTRMLVFSWPPGGR